MEINKKMIKRVKINLIADVKCASTLGKLESKEISMCIAQVSINYYHNNDNKVKTYSMLDNCSQGSFVHEAVLKQL